jgi:hypothetical protein
MSEENVKKSIKTPEEYIKLQPVERQEALKKLRSIIIKNLPVGFTEIIQYGAIGYVVPHSFFPAGYHVNPEEPLPFMALANQKNYIALYHLGIYADKILLDWFVNEYQTLNIAKLDMGKSCIRFKNIDKIPYKLIAELCSKVTVEEYINVYQRNLRKK